MKIIIIPMLPTLYGRRYQLAKHLAANHEVHFILWTMPYPITFRNLKLSFKESWKSKEWEQDGIIIHKVKRLPFFLPPINKTWFQKQIRTLFKQNHIDAIISQSFFNESEPPKELPLYFDYNDDYQAFARIYGSATYKLAYRVLGVNKTVEAQQRRAKAIFAVSTILVQKAKLLNNNVYYVPNGVEASLAPLNSLAKVPQFGPHSVIYVSTFGKWSQVIPLIHTVNELRHAIPDIKLFIVGEGTEIAQARQEVKKYDLDNYIEITGPIYDRVKLFELISNCAVCLNISEKNDFRDAASPIKVFEYSLLGKVIISTDLAEVESLHFDNVLTFNNLSHTKSMEAALTKAFALKINAEAIQHNILEKYTWEHQIEKILIVIKDTN